MALKGEGSIADEVNAKAAHANGKMKRKVYEKELHKLELCQLIAPMLRAARRGCRTDF